MDLIWPIDRGGYILLVIDVFTRFFVTRIMKDKTPSHVCNALQNVLRTHSKPKMILSKNGRGFVNAEIETFLASVGIEMRHGSQYTPITTGPSTVRYISGDNFKENHCVVNAWVKGQGAAGYPSVQ